jgi:hypothetical protein
VDLEKVGTDPLVKAVFEEGIDARMLQDEVLEGIADVLYIEHPALVSGA